MSEYVIFIKRIGLVGITNVLVAVKGIILLSILTKYLGAYNYGIWTQIIITISFLQPFIQLGLPAALLRFLATKEKKEIVQGLFTVLSIILFTGIIMSFILFLCSDFLSLKFLRDTSAGMFIRIASLMLIFEALYGTLLGSFRIFGHISRFSLVSLFRAISEIGLILLFFKLGYGLTGAILAMMITVVISIIFMLFLIISYAGISKPDYSIIKPYLAYSIPLVPTFMFQFIISASDRYIIGFYKGAAEVGIYSASYSIGNLLILFVSFVVYILRPLIYKEHDEANIEKVKNYLSNSFKYTLMLVIPSAMGISIMTKGLLGTFTTLEFVSTGRIIIPLISVSMILYSADQIFESVLLFRKRTITFFTIYGIAALVNLGLNVAFVPFLGVVGAAIASLITYIFTASIICYKSRQYLKFDLGLLFLAKCIISSIPMALVIWLINPEGIFKICLSVVVGACIYFVLLFILKGISKKEINFFSLLLKSK